MSLVFCNRQHEVSQCDRDTQTHSWQRSQHGSGWCCAGLGTCRCRHRHLSPGRWWSTVLLLHKGKNRVCIRTYTYIHFIQVLANGAECCTLSASVDTAGDRLSILSGPEEIVRRRSRHLTPQSDGVALWHEDSLWINSDHEWGCNCKCKGHCKHISNSLCGEVRLYHNGFSQHKLRRDCEAQDLNLFILLETWTYFYSQTNRTD